jgi:hypothetical protein
MSAEPWLDRLARRLTRREALRAGALTAAAATVPVSLWRAAPGLADGLPDNSACYKGCNWFVHQEANIALQQCGQRHASSYDTLRYGGAAIIASTGLLSLAPLRAVANYIDAQEKTCEDQALLNGKAAVFECITQPNCDDFDPMQPGGPCDTCTAAAGSCCPDSLVAQGYSCCTHGSVTPC